MNPRICVASIAIALAFTAATASAASAASAATPNTPQSIDETPIFLPADPSLCKFPIVVIPRGKSKTITLPGNRTLFIAPGQEVEIVNGLDASKRYAQTVTGTFHQFIDANGSVITRSTGRSLLGDPTTGLVFVTGNFEYVFDANGTLIKPLTGTERMVDACALIA